jgi:Uma2 family endonuclease
VALNIQRVFIEDFEAFVNLSENAEKLFEFIGGEIVEVPSNPYSSQIALRISGFIFMYLMENNIGHLTGAAGGYMVGGDRYAPDVAFISSERQPQLVRTGYNPIPPDLAVEMLSPTDTETTITHKVVNYLRAGTVVWVVNPETQTVAVFHPTEESTKLDNSQTLDGGTVLPGFSLPIKDIFPPQE